MKSIRRHEIAWAKLSLTAAVAVTLLVIAGEFLPVGPDYYYNFRPIAEDVLSGNSILYDQNGHGYYNPPWGILLVLPTLILSPSYGQGLFTVTTLTALAVSVYVFARADLHVAILAIANLYTVDRIVLGNVDGFVLLGVSLAVLAVRRKSPHLLGLGFWLMSVKPVNVILPALVLIWMTWDWNWRDKAICVAPTVTSFLVSFPLFGWWPTRYAKYLWQRTTTSPYTVHPQTTLWRLIGQAGLPRWFAGAVAILVIIVFLLTVRKAGSLESNVSSALAASLTVTPYAFSGYYILLAPVFALLAMKNKTYLLTWFLTFTPLLRLAQDSGAARIDIVYPVALFVLLSWGGRCQSPLVKNRVDSKSGYMPRSATDAHQEAQSVIKHGRSDG